MSTYDALVIGAGHNGLACAIHLASKGWKVAVIEARDEPGGAVKTREVTLPGFHHDLFAMSLNLFAQSGFNRAYGEDLQAHGLAFVPAPNAVASVFPDGTYLGIGTDIPETKRAIAALSPRDAEAWSAMLNDFARKAPVIGGIMSSRMPSWETLKLMWSAWRTGGFPFLLDLVRLVVSSPREFLDRHFESEKLKVTMAAWGAHVDFAPETAGGATFTYLQSMASQLGPMLIGAGGADTIIKAMTSLLRARGGELMLSSPVAKVLTEGNRAVGVTLENGKTLHARRAVVSNLHPKLIFGSMIGKTDRREAFDAAIAKYRAGPASMTIHLALDGLPQWTASKMLGSYSYIHIAPSLDSIDRTYRDARQGLLPGEPLLVVGQPTAFDPSRAPAGKHTLWIQVRFLPNEIKGDARGDISSTDWDEAKEAYADRVIDIIERYAPGLKQQILGRHVISPKELERENPNLIDGDGTAGSHHLDQNFFLRPVPGYSRYKTPVKNLYICGAATWPGAGTSATSGYLVARMLAG
ncbi:NAD(P)/FAD-dependent oxidoreductase (plasmid) [Agrobacterium leguminum]|uniref:phytoene desaturase family protein n=1 Tax=Agrobacterium leguminum TaxID=2792015 RepID=UPI0027296896|nr:NAD(P)/FAD-dependent oxidoreductase [Agrobacterium leguminum]WLE00596.1 NAD(P)/FAD-dependent oxidoreductase [Agrobacterium leguminum]